MNTSKKNSPTVADLEWEIQACEDPSRSDVILSGSIIVSGSAILRVCRTGHNTHIGKILEGLHQNTERKNQDANIHEFTLIMIRFICIMAPLVLLLQLYRHGLAMEPFMYAISVSVGLAPEMLPMIICACLVKGARDLSSQGLSVVKRLNAVQALGSMDILCTDKTGTLTNDKMEVELSVDPYGNRSENVLAVAKINNYFQTGIFNAVEKAVLNAPISPQLEVNDSIEKVFEVIDEEPFDFESRYSSVLVQVNDDQRLSNEFVKILSNFCGAPLHAGDMIHICKGARAEVTSLCSHVVFANGCVERLYTTENYVAGNSEVEKPFSVMQRGVHDTIEELESTGVRLLACAIKRYEPSHSGSASSCLDGNLILVGFLTFSDQPKESSLYAVKSLQHQGISVRVLTGDAENVAKAVAEKVGVVNPSFVMLGDDIDTLISRENLNDKNANEILSLSSNRNESSCDDIENAADVLKRGIQACHVFARLTPRHKQIIVNAFKADNNVVGFLGDGVNDCAALHAADVGISVDTATKAAKSAADVILVKKSLTYLETTVLTGRRCFVNMVKYVRMAASSNWGNMFSVVGASLSLPFIPMLPMQVVLSNLLYDIAQLGIPTDHIDPEQIQRPQKWDLSSLQKFIIYLGFVSSVFDFITFFVMYNFVGGKEDPKLFQTGWFVEGLLSQTLIVFVLRRTVQREDHDPDDDNDNDQNRFITRGWRRRFNRANFKRQLGLDTPPSKTLVLISALVILAGLGLPHTEFTQSSLGFTSLPPEYYLYLIGILLGYIVTTSVTLPLLEPKPNSIKSA